MTRQELDLFLDKLDLSVPVNERDDINNQLFICYKSIKLNK